jgi:hypothetical protein
MRPGIDQAEILSLTMPCLLNRLPGLLSGTHVGFSRHFVLSLTFQRQADAGGPKEPGLGGL